MDDEVKRIVTTSFMLGLRISQSINNLPPPDRIRYTALMETLISVAGGEELTLETAPDLQEASPATAESSAIQRDYALFQQLIAKTVLDRLR
ncbi:hypothetical protein [Anatilimnocola floriformis]|uniref:hypothetical protein n=1 Tax=Anatilimnocola floriformis TaxID=2948575 RepID=UPI0020C2FEBE|nr:hypothetical protein [Anatilimnocola floriformis]